MPVYEIKDRLGIAFEDISQDPLLNTILADAQAFFKDHCNRSDIPDAATSVIDRLAVVLYDRNADRYKQGGTVGAYSSTSFALGDDIPKSIMKQLRQYKKGRKVTFL